MLFRGLPGNSCQFRILTTFQLLVAATEPPNTSTSVQKSRHDDDDNDNNDVNDGDDEGDKWL